MNVILLAAAQQQEPLVSDEKCSKKITLSSKQNGTDSVQTGQTSAVKLHQVALIKIYHVAARERRLKISMLMSYFELCQQGQSRIATEISNSWNKGYPLYLTACLSQVPESFKNENH